MAVAGESTEGSSAAASTKRSADGAPVAAPPAKRSKKGKKKARPGGLDINPEDYAQIMPFSKKSDLLAEGLPVQLSKNEKASNVTLSEDKLSMTSAKGYRMCRATHGAYSGTWFFEVRVGHLGASGHCRLGWSTKKGELQAPVGYDQHSYGYRDLEGSKVHKALREDYGEPFRENDVIGCLLHMPEGGRPFEVQLSDIVTWKGNLYTEVKAEPEPGVLAGSCVAFARNGRWQGVAYEDLREGTYYPAASLFTLPDQREGATVTFNFGPEFEHPPNAMEGEPPVPAAPRPACELAQEVARNPMLAGDPLAAELERRKEEEEERLAAKKEEERQAVKKEEAARKAGSGAAGGPS